MIIFFLYFNHKLLSYELFVKSYITQDELFRLEFIVFIVCLLMTIRLLTSAIDVLFIL